MSIRARINPWAGMRAGYAMNYPDLLSVTHYLGLLLMFASAVALLQNLTVCFFLRGWNAKARQGFSQAMAVEAAGLLLFAFSSGGLFALQFITSNTLPPPALLVLRIALLVILSCSVVFLLVIARPWLMNARPMLLSRELGPHQMLAMSLAFASFAAAWIAWVVAGMGTSLPISSPVGAGVQANIPHLGHVALMTLLFWTVLAVPALLLSALAAYRHRDGFADDPDLSRFDDTVPASGEDYAVDRYMPRLVDIPVPARVHIPARRAPRPALVPHDEYAPGFGNRVARYYHTPDDADQNAVHHSHTYSEDVADQVPQLVAAGSSEQAVDNARFDDITSQEVSGEEARFSGYRPGEALIDEGQVFQPRFSGKRFAVPFGREELIPQA